MQGGKNISLPCRYYEEKRDAMDQYEKPYILIYRRQPQQEVWDWQACLFRALLLEEPITTIADRLLYCQSPRFDVLQNFQRLQYK